MGKVSPNPITSLEQNWSNDTNVNLPFSGEAVQNFIKQYLQRVTNAAWFDPQSYTMFFFDSQESMQEYQNDPSQIQLIQFAVPMNFSSTLYRIKITNNTGSTSINTATNAGTCPLSANFVVQTKSITDVEWTDTQIGAYVTIEIDRGVTGNFVPITERALYAANTDIELDVFNELSLGISRIRYKFEAEDESCTAALTYTVNLSELYVELASNTWYSPILQSFDSSWYLGGFHVAGAGFKTLHFDLYDHNNTLLEQLQVTIGTSNAYINTPYFYRFDNSSPIFQLATGVYKVRTYVTTDTLTSEYVDYNIMYVSANDTETAQLVVANEMPEQVFNYSTSTICKYGVYNGGSTLSNITIGFERLNGSTVVDRTESQLIGVETGKAHNLEYLAEWEVMGDGYFIGFDVTAGESVAHYVLPLDNTFIFPPTEGYDFYLNAATRYNSDTNKDKLINGSDSSVLNATWNNIDFLDNVDGWTIDNEGRKCLRIPAGCSLTLPSSEFKFFDKDNITIELAYKVANVADTDENVITIASNPTSEGFSGLVIRPNNIIVHSINDVTSDNDSARGTRMCDEQLTHFALTINPNFEGSHKIVKGFLNGCKNFEFSYTTGSDWLVNADLTIAPQKSDVFLYFIRRYPTALADQLVQNNYINSLYNVDDRKLVSALLESVVDAGQTNVDFESVRDNRYNYFVITMQNGASVPSAANGWGKKTTGTSILEMHYGQHPEWDWKIGPLETAGQGTTSMNYYRWNIRFRIDKTDDTKKVPVQYCESRTRVGDSYQYTWGPVENSKTVIFDGEGNHPALKRITAKINAASSMQSHKMGSTKAYNDLALAIGLQNEAQAAAIASNNPVPTTAVYQYPAFGFEYDPIYGTYTFCGLFTIGPDKGDKPTFGFDTTESGLISLEGTDHSQPLAKFAYPWNNDVRFISSEEGLAIVKGSGNYLTGLEVGNCFGLSPDKASDQSAVETKLVQEFKPAYDIVWNNSTLIFPIALGTYGNTAQSTLTYINNHLNEFRSTKYNSRFSYSDMQFWIEGEYILYYYDEVLERFVAGQTLTNPSTGTLEQQNENFKARRRIEFKENAENYWDIQNALYHFDFLLIYGATDNFAKNSYPYKMKPLAQGGRWMWRQDDLDTIFDIDNAGGDTKPYYIEYEDSDGETLSMAGAPYFSGSNSIFWNLIYECYWEDYVSTVSGVNTRGLRTMGGDILAKMRDLSGQSNVYDGFVNYIKQVYWDKAQNYFPQSAYNIDANFKYEQAWINNGQAVDPLSQALGNHKSAEELWVRNRAIYMASLFRTGAFGDYSDNSLGTIAFRPANVTTLELSPSMWMYPAMISGQASPTTGERTSPGNSTTISVTSSGGTTLEIQGSNYLNEIGDFKNVVLDAGYMNPVSITAARLTNFKIGDADPASITTNIFNLQFPNNKCLETIDGRNVQSLTNVDVSSCSRLKELYLSGSNVSNVILPRGCKITNLSLPETIQSINFRDLKHLANQNLYIEGYENIRTIFIEHILADGIDITKQALANSQYLSAIRLIWDDQYVDTDGTLFETLFTLTNGNYQGLSPDGEIVENPIIEGRVYVPRQIYTDELIQIQDVCPTIDIVADSILFRFEDNAVGQICINTWGSGGTLTLEQVQSVTNITNTFTNNTSIVSFNEYKFFTGVTAMTGSGVYFNGCTSLKYIKLPDTLTSISGTLAFSNTAIETIDLKNITDLGYGVFSGCTSLSEVEISNNMTSIGARAFYNCTSLENIDLSTLQNVTFLGEFAFNNCPITGSLFLSSLQSVERYAFYNTNITSVSNLGNITSTSANMFEACTLLKTVTLPSGCITVDNSTFRNCSSLEAINMPNVRSIGIQAFQNCSSLTSIVCPNLVEIRNSAFDGCNFSDSSNISINWSNVIGVGSFAFNNTLLDINELSIPNLLSFGIEGGAFRGCNIKRITNLGSIVSIPNNTFANNVNLEEVTVPQSCTNISSAFQGCTSLQKFTILSNTCPAFGNTFVSSINEIWIKPQAVQSWLTYDTPPNAQTTQYRLNWMRCLRLIEVEDTNYVLDHAITMESQIFRNDDYCVTKLLRLPPGVYNVYTGFNSWTEGINQFGRVMLLDADCKRLANYNSSTGVFQMTISNVNVHYCRLTVKSSELSNCYIQNAGTEEYIWRGSDVVARY